MKHITKLLAMFLFLTLFSGCDIITILLEGPTPPVEINYTWWNNLIDVPVIEGTIQNNTSFKIWKTTIEVQTFNSKNECIYSTCISVYENIEAGKCAPFKQWISGSDEACNLKARVVSYD